MLEAGKRIERGIEMWNGDLGMGIRKWRLGEWGFVNGGVGSVNRGLGMGKRARLG